MIINYLDVVVNYARKGKIDQSLKISQWARNDFEKKRGINHKTNGIKKI